MSVCVCVFVVVVVVGGDGFFVLFQMYLYCGGLVWLWIRLWLVFSSCVVGFALDFHAAQFHMKKIAVYLLMQVSTPKKLYHSSSCTSIKCVEYGTSRIVDLQTHSFSFSLARSLTYFHLSFAQLNLCKIQ